MRSVRGPIGSVIGTFKMFNIGVLELLARMPLQQKIYMTLLLALMAGIEGLPFAEDIEDLIDTIGQRFPELGVTTNSKKWLDKTSRKVFGQFLGNAFVQGLPSALMPFDVSQRMSMGNLIPGTALAKVRETDKTRDIRDLLGPAVSLLYGVYGGAEDLLHGNYLAAGKRALPLAAQNVLKGAEMVAKGEAQDLRGQRITKTTPLEGVGKMLGLNPNVVAERQRVQASIKNDEQYLTVTRGVLLDQYVNALISHKQDVAEEILKKIRAWNKANPSMPITLNPRSISERMSNMMSSQENRLTRAAPRAMRGEVLDQLQTLDR